MPISYKPRWNRQSTCCCICFLLPFVRSVVSCVVLVFMFLCLPFDVLCVFQISMYVGAIWQSASLPVRAMIIIILYMYRIDLYVTVWSWCFYTHSVTCFCWPSSSFTYAQIPMLIYCESACIALHVYVCFVCSCLFVCCCRRCCYCLFVGFRCFSFFDPRHTKIQIIWMVVVVCCLCLDAFFLVVWSCYCCWLPFFWVFVVSFSRCLVVIRAPILIIIHLLRFIYVWVCVCLFRVSRCSLLFVV